MNHKDMDLIISNGITIEDIKKQKEDIDYTICALQDYKDGQNAETIVNALVTRFKNDLH